MNIAIIGTGKIGGMLGRLWARQGHRIIFASRHPGAPKLEALLAQVGAGAVAAPVAEGVAQAEVVLLAVPYRAMGPALAAAGDLAGKILIDPTNPLGPQGLLVGHTDSAAEQAARLAPGARVVKAFNTVGWDSLANPRVAGSTVTLPIAGDDADAKAAVAALAAELGFEVADAGPLEASRLIEPLALLWIRFSMSLGPGHRVGIKLLTEHAPRRE